MGKKLFTKLKARNKHQQRIMIRIFTKKKKLKIISMKKINNLMNFNERIVQSIKNEIWPKQKHTANKIKQSNGALDK